MQTPLATVPPSVTAAVPAGPVTPVRDRPPHHGGPEGLWPVLWRGRGVIVLALVVSAAAAYAYLRLTPPTFVAKAKLMIGTPTRVLEQAGGADASARAAANLNTQCTLIASTPVLSAALADLPAARAAQDPVGYLRGRVSAELGKRDDLITVAAEGGSRGDAEQTLQAVLNAYQAYVVGQGRADDSSMLARLASERSKREEELAAVTQAMVQFRMENRTVSFGADAANVVFQRLAKLSDALTAAQLASIDARAAADGAQTAAMRRQAEIVAGKEQAIRQQFEDANRAAMALNAKAAEYAKLEVDQTRAQQICDVLDKRMKEVAIAGGGSGAAPVSVRVVEPPTAEPKPAKPDVTKVAALAAAAGLLLGAAGAMLGDRLDQRLRTGEQIAAAGGVAVVGVVPEMRGLSLVPRGPLRRGQRVRLAPRSLEAEAYRGLRTTLCLGGFPSRTGSTGRAVLVTSPARGDGKSTTASNLAISMAQAGHRVLLMDCDLRCPSQHAVFGMDNSVGVSSVFLRDGRASFGQTIRRTPVGNLDLVSAGPLPPNPAELLGSPTFAQMIAAASHRYDYVLLDSPPVTAVTDARILAAGCDATLLVVRANRSTVAALEAARDGLLSVGARLFGTVVNAVGHRQGRSRFHSGFGYTAYGYGGAAPSPALFVTDADLASRGGGRVDVAPHADVAGLVTAVGQAAALKPAVEAAETPGPAAAAKPWVMHRAASGGVTA